MKEQLAIVTASSRGIGRAVAIELAAAGFSVVVNGLKRDHVATVVSEIRSAWPQSVAVGCVGDLREQRTCVRLIECARRTGLSLSAAFINTPSPTIGISSDISNKEWEHALLSMVRFPDHALRMFADEIARNGKGGAIVVNSSCSAISPVGDEFYFANTLRSASVAQAKAYARAFIQRGIRINALLTGFVDTDLTRSACSAISRRCKRQPRQLWREWGRAIPIGRLATPNEIARVARFLLTEESSYIVGSAIEVDGGIGMMHRNV